METNIPLDKQIAFAQLGYRIESSNIITASIDSAMITATTLPDGSEGLKLDWEAAGPMLDDFFGRTGAGSQPDGESATTSKSSTPRTGSTRGQGSATR